MKFDQLQNQWSRIRQNFTHFTWGGTWALSLSVENRKNLTFFFYDGLFAAASDKIVLTYLTIYILSLGATRQQIGLLSSLSNFAAALMLLPAAMLVERTGKRQQITIAGASASRLVVLMMAVIPFFLKDFSGLIWLLLGLGLLREVFNNIGYPGWIALTGDIVPIEGRGRYFGARNFIMGLAGIITALLIGEAITQIGGPLGYQISFILAAILGGFSIYFFSRLKDPQKDHQSDGQTSSNLKAILSSIKGHPHFIAFILFAAVWNFSINIFAPFFNVFMVDTLRFTAAMIGVTAVANTTANLVIQRRIGNLADRWGNRNVSIVFMLLIPLLPLAWGLWIRQYWQAILFEVLSGLFWGAYNLASFNTLLLQTPEKLRARFSAFHQIIVTLSLAGGAALGSFLITLIDFKGVALVSAIGRWIAGILFLLIVHDQLPSKEPQPSAD